MTVTNRRIFYAVEQVGFAKNGTNTFTSAHGVQSVGINTKFNLEQALRTRPNRHLSEYRKYSWDIEVTTEKVLDGYPLTLSSCDQRFGFPVAFRSLLTRRLLSACQFIPTPKIRLPVLRLPNAPCPACLSARWPTASRLMVMRPSR